MYKYCLLAGLVAVAAMAVAQPVKRPLYRSPRDLYRYDTIYFKGNSLTSMRTSIHLKKNEYVYIEVYGKVKVGPYLGEADGAGLLANSLFSTTYNKYKDHRHGCLMFLMNGKAESCKRILSDLGSKYDLPGIAPDYGVAYVPGNYFIANADATLSFDINDIDPANNTGQFIISVIRMRYEDHLARNYFNRCPEKEPVDEKDCFGQPWVKESIKSWWYHGINDSFRGGKENPGCQCVYDNDKLITTGEDKGSFDIGYWHFKGDLTKPQAHYYHLVLDVIPHDLFIAKLDQEPDYLYQQSLPCK